MSGFYDMSAHFRAPPAPPDLSSYATQYMKQNRPAKHMRQQASQARPQNIRQSYMDEEEEIARERLHKLRRLKQKAGGRKSSRHFVYSTYKEGGKTFVAFEKSMFVTMILLLSIGIGVLAIDARKFLHFIGHTIRRSVSAMTS